jgi:hypothetical protein
MIATLTANIEHIMTNPERLRLREEYLQGLFRDSSNCLSPNWDPSSAYLPNGPTERITMVLNSQPYRKGMHLPEEEEFRRVCGSSSRVLSCTKSIAYRITPWIGRWTRQRRTRLSWIGCLSMNIRIRVGVQRYDRSGRSEQCSVQTSSAARPWSSVGGPSNQAWVRNTPLSCGCLSICILWNWSAWRGEL